ncbi:MAG: hypothetical protein SGBAC_005712 [Bacillariaceae sp.]
MRKKKVAVTTSPSPSKNGDSQKEEKSVLSFSSGASSLEVSQSSQQSSRASSIAHSVRFSVLGIAGITVNAPHLEKLQKMEGAKESSYFSAPSKMKSVVTITSNNKVVGITDLSKPLTSAHSTFQKEANEHRHLAFWANEQELTLGSGMRLHSSGAETFHMTIGITDGILPAMPIGTACLVLDAKQMIEDGRVAAVLDLPIQNAADKKMISVDSHVATNATKSTKKKKKWFTRSSKEPSKPQQIDFHSVYSTDKTGDAILRIQINLKADDQESSVSTTVDNTVETESRTSEVKSKSSAGVQRKRSAEVERKRSAASSEVQRKRSAEVEQKTITEVQRKQSAGVQRNPSRDVKHTIVDLDESVADSESEVSIEDNILGVSIEEYNMLQILAQKRSSLQKTSIAVPYESESQQKQEETKEADDSFANMFRGAMDNAISNFFTSSQPSFFSSTEIKEDQTPHEEGIEISLPSLGLPSLTRIDESSSTLNHEDPVIHTTEGREIVSAPNTTDLEISNSLLAGTENNEGPKKALTAREQMVQNLEKKNHPSKSNQEEKEDHTHMANAPLHTATTGSPQGVPPSGRQPTGSGLPPRPGGRPPRPTTSRPPLPPSQVRSRGREDPNIPTSIMAGPINKSWTLLDDDTYTLTVEGHFPPQNGHPETKEGEPVAYQSRQQLPVGETRITQVGGNGLDRLFQCGQAQDVPSLGGKDMTKLQQQAIKTQKIKTPTPAPKKPDDDEVSLRVPAVIIQYDHMSVTYDDLTVDTRDFPPLRGKGSKKHRNHLSRRTVSRNRTMKKRANRTVGPDDESAGSGSDDSISAFIKEVDMQLFDDEDEVESLLQL